MADRYFEDFKVGERFFTESVTVTEAAVIDFALTYDPQPIHIDVLAAKSGPYGGLIASGLQTMALTARLFLDLKLLRACSMGSPGMDELRFRKPVRPGDTLRVELEVLEVRASSSKPDRGIVRIGYATLNQNNDTVMTYSSLQLVKKRSG